MELSDAAKREIQAHRNLELGKNYSSDVGRYEIKIHMNMELGKYVTETDPANNYLLNVHDTYCHFRF